MMMTREHLISDIAWTDWRRNSHCIVLYCIVWWREDILFQTRLRRIREETPPNQRGPSRQDELSQTRRDVRPEPRQAYDEDAPRDGRREEHDADGDVTRTSEDPRLTGASFRINHWGLASTCSEGPRLIVGSSRIRHRTNKGPR